MREIGYFKNWWTFKIGNRWFFKSPVYLIEYELKYSRAIPDGQDVAAMTFGKLWWVSVRVERKYQANKMAFTQILHHEYRHVMDRSHPLRFNRKRSRLEKDAREYATKMYGEAVPWL